jgi:hypothetical protein
MTKRQAAAGVAYVLCAFLAIAGFCLLIAALIIAMPGID